jgi:hypothetical protein
MLILAQSLQISAADAEEILFSGSEEEELYSLYIGEHGKGACNGFRIFTANRGVIKPEVLSAACCPERELPNA